MHFVSSISSDGLPLTSAGRMAATGQRDVDRAILPREISDLRAVTTHDDEASAATSCFGARCDRLFGPTAVGDGDNDVGGAEPGRELVALDDMDRDRALESRDRGEHVTADAGATHADDDD